MPEIDSLALAWRNHILLVAKGHQDTPICLSGGVDSGTILAAQLALGGNPSCFTFHLEGFKSNDFNVAHDMTLHYGLDLYYTVIPRDQLVPDVKRIINEFSTARKTHIQCIHPLLYIANQAAELGVKEIMLGTGGVVEDNRTCAVALHKYGEDAARKIRTKNLLHIEGSATEQMHRTFEQYGINVIEPFSTQPFADFHLSIDMKEINSPRQKGIALRAFPEFWENPWWRKNTGLQVGTGIRAWHDTLIKTFNPSRSKSVVGIYNYIKRTSA